MINNVKIMTSYFYQIRFMKNFMIPLSTCLSDPKWFHQNKGKDFFYKDKNGVYNGLRAEPFVPIMQDNEECSGRANCNLESCECKFLSNYYNQLNSLDFNSIIQRFNRLGNFIKEKENFMEVPIMVLIVYETPDNKCSERVVLKKWFAEHSYNLEEFSNRA